MPDGNACKRKRRRFTTPEAIRPCSLSAACLGLVITYFSVWDCRILACVSRMWRDCIANRVRRSLSLTSGPILRLAMVIRSRRLFDLQGSLSDDGSILLVTRPGEPAGVFTSNDTAWQRRTLPHDMQGQVELLGGGRLIVQRNVRSSRIQWWSTNPMQIVPKCPEPQDDLTLHNLQTIGVIDRGSTLVAQYATYMHGYSCEFRIVRIDSHTGQTEPTQIRLFSGRHFAKETIEVNDQTMMTEFGKIADNTCTNNMHESKSIESTITTAARIYLRCEHSKRFYRTPIIIGDESSLLDVGALTFSELSHLISPCGRYLSVGCWLTNSQMGVDGAWFTASLFDLNDARRVNFTDPWRNSIVSSFSTDGSMLLLGWRARKSKLPWETMEIYSVTSLFTQGSRPAPLCIFDRSTCLSGDHLHTRLAMTWSGRYVLMAEVDGVTVLDPSAGGTQLAVITASDLVQGRSHAKVLNICCQGRAALVFLPTSRACRIGSLLLVELTTCRTLLVVSERIAFSDSLGESVVVADHAQSVMFKSADGNIRVFDGQATCIAQVVVD